MQLLIAPSHDFYDNFLFLTFCLTVGIFEELFFRVFVYNYFIDSENSTIKAILKASVIFGLVHLNNFFTQEPYILSVVNQVIFAFGIGILFQALYIRFQSITLVIMLHSLINYFGSYKSGLLNFNIIDAAADTGYSLRDFFTTFAVFSFLIVVLILPISYFLLKDQIKKNSTTLV